MRHAKVFVGVPIYGAIPAGFFQSMMQFHADPKVEAYLHLKVGDSLVSRARNCLAADFLATDCTHLLFIDSDLVFSADQVARLVSHDVDIVGGCYPAKAEGKIKWIVNTHHEPKEIQANGLQEMRYVGTGFMLVKREIFLRMIEQFGEAISYKPDESKRSIEWDFFAVGPYQYPDGSRRYLSEDWYFCQRALDLGFKVWADTRVILKHIGQAIYPLQSQQHELQNEPV